MPLLSSLNFKSEQPSLVMYLWENVEGETPIFNMRIILKHDALPTKDILEIKYCYFTHLTEKNEKIKSKLIFAN